jgi:hypothetical protein
MGGDKLGGNAEARWIGMTHAENLLMMILTLSRSH